MHPDLEQLQRFLHGELPGAQAELIRKHLDTCTDCRVLHQAAQHEETEVHALLQRLDHGPAAVSVSQVAIPRPIGGYRHKRAAAILLALGLAGAVYAVPGSPVRSWLNAQFGSSDRTTGVQQPTAAPFPDADQAGVDIEPGSQLTIDFARKQTQGHVLVSLTGDTKLTVRTENGSARFTSGADRLIVDNIGSSIFYVQIPRSAHQVEIRVAGQRMLLKQDASITTAAAADAAGRFALPLQ